MIGSVVWVTFFPYGVIIVRGGPILMFLAFIGNPCPRIDIPMKHIYANICLIFIKITMVIHYQRNYIPTNWKSFCDSILYQSRE